MLKNVVGRGHVLAVVFAILLFVPSLSIANDEATREATAESSMYQVVHLQSELGKSLLEPVTMFPDKLPDPPPPHTRHG
jgi:hypothetical protein